MFDQQGHSTSDPHYRHDDKTIHVLIIENDQDDFYLTQKHLSKNYDYHYQIVQAQTLAEANKTIATNTVDVVLLDLGLTASQGLPTLSSLLAQGHDIPIIVLTGIHDNRLGTQAIRLGAADYIPKDSLYHDNLARQISFALDRFAQARTLKQLALVDPLTNLPNRRALTEYFWLRQAAWSRENTNDKTAALVMMDLDGFKNINDSFGHIAGDNLLSRIGQHLNKVTRDSDFIARLGGDEFVYVFENYDTHQALITLIERRRKEIEAIAQSINLKVTASFGAYELQYPCLASLTSLLHHADSALYNSKTSGKNKLCFYDACNDPLNRSLTPA